MSTTADKAFTAAADARLDALARARQLLGEDAPLDEAMRIAEWLLTGSMPINPERLENAARMLAESNGHNWTRLSQADADRRRGQALRTVIAYLND